MHGGEARIGSKRSNGNSAGCLACDPSDACMVQLASHALPVTLFVKRISSTSTARRRVIEWPPQHTRKRDAIHNALQTACCSSVRSSGCRPSSPTASHGVILRCCEQSSHGTSLCAPPLIEVYGDCGVLPGNVRHTQRQAWLAPGLAPADADR
jgi:hypothetical protein